MRNDSMTIITAKGAVALLIFWALLIFAGIFSGGCVSQRIAPEAPATPEAGTLGRTASEPQWNTVRARGPYIRGADVWVKPGYGPGTTWEPQPTDSLYLRARIYGIGGTPWRAQIQLNTDSDASTGWGPRGSDHVALMSLADADGIYPIRSTVGNPANPGGWGDITGYGRLVTTNGSLRTSIPLSAFPKPAYYGWMKLRLDVFIGAGNWSDVSEASFYAFADLHTYPYADTLPDWHPPADDDPSAERSIAAHVRR